MTVQLDGVGVGTVTTDSAGAGTLVITIDKKATVGTHTVTASAPDGTSNSAQFQVTKKNTK